MLNWFNSLTTIQKVLVIAGVILLIVFLFRRYSSQLRNIFQKKEIEPVTVTLQNGQTVTLTTIADLPDTQKKYLEDLAGKIRDDIYGINITHNMDLYKEGSVLSDVEIDYLAQYYKRNLTNGNSLWQDMSDELVSCYIQDCTGWKALNIKLEKTGNR